MRFSVVFFILNLLYSIGSCYAQNSIVIERARVFDGEKFIGKKNILIKDSVIKKISNFKIKGSFTRIDGRGKTLVPALINAHVHAYFPQHLEEAAKAGVLTVMDMGGFEKGQKQLKKVISKGNYASYLTSGAVATVSEGHGTQFGFPTPTIISAREAKSFVQDRILNGANHIKIILEPSMPTLEMEVIDSIIAFSKLYGKKSIVHISRKRDAIEVLKIGASGLAHIWYDEPVTEQELIDLMKNNSFFVVPTLSCIDEFYKIQSKNNNKAKTLQEQVYNDLALLKKFKIPVLIGTDSPNFNLNYGSDIYSEMELLMEAGFTLEETLNASSKLSAQCFGLKNLGMVKEGHLADLILMDGNLEKDGLSCLKGNKTIWKSGRQLVFED